MAHSIIEERDKNFRFQSEYCTVNAKLAVVLRKELHVDEVIITLNMCALAFNNLNPAVFNSMTNVDEADSGSSVLPASELIYNTSICMSGKYSCSH